MGISLHETDGGNPDDASLRLTDVDATLMSGIDGGCILAITLHDDQRFQLERLLHDHNQRHPRKGDAR